ncbi:unnamed protein product [Ceutorhynchus assimilis]|uniref:Uncharacterized protein n=1 Tax=Ceutorhynchus assimilis TaxID=467358 RepID=A0A9N9M9A8_9CUCU|nr:unnamed protein product [Ceutorhynchus assimilis]
MIFQEKISLTTSIRQRQLLRIITYWDRSILTDRHIPANRPDITLLDKRNREAYLIDVTVPDNNNMQETIQSEVLEYTELSDEIKEQWQLNKVTVVPIIMSTPGIIPYSLVKILTTLGLTKHLVAEIQSQ